MILPLRAASFSPLLVLIFGAFLAAGCGGSGVGNDGDVVGGSCTEDDHCDRGSFCQRGGDFPDGTCTRACNDDRDCPGGTACIDEDGGICLLLCDFDTDCRNGWECEDASRRGHSGSATVCIGD